jgi:hypothetical protein
MVADRKSGKVALAGGEEPVRARGGEACEDGEPKRPAHNRWPNHSNPLCHPASVPFHHAGRQ